MKKISLSIFIVLCAAFIYVKFQLLGAADSSFNRSARFMIGRYQLARSLFGLHSDGDARAWYLQGTQPLIIEVVTAKGVGFAPEVIDKFSQDVQAYTGRGVQIFQTETVSDGVLSGRDLNSIARGTRHHAITGQPNLFIVYAQDYENSGSEVGKTYQEYGIVLSHQNLLNVTRQYPTAIYQYELSTLMHEFGHQIGLGHNTSQDCIMNASVESPAVGAGFNGTYTVTDFCDYEKQLIQDIKKSL